MQFTSDNDRNYHIEEQTIDEVVQNGFDPGLPSGIKDNKIGDCDIIIFFSPVSISGKTPFRPQARITGTYKRDGLTIVDKGSMFKIIDLFFKKFGVKHMFDTEQEQIPVETLSQFKGKKALTLRYKIKKDDGVVTWRYFDFLANPDATYWMQGQVGAKEWLEGEFLKKVKSAYPPRNYVGLETS